MEDRGARRAKEGDGLEDRKESASCCLEFGVRCAPGPHYTNSAGLEHALDV